MKFRFEPILPDFPENMRWIYEGSKLYLDPFYSPSCYIEQLDVLPLLIDKIIVFDPSEGNLKTWNYPFDRFSSLVEERAFIPLFLDEEQGSPFETCIFRKDLLPDESFFGEYDKAIDEDLNDAEFVRIVESLNLDLDTTAFSVNWDLIVSQVLMSPILTTDSLTVLWQYKFQKIIYDISAFSEIPESVMKSNVLRSFFYRTIERLPRDLSVDDILEFRSDRTAREFRKWFSNEINRIMTMSTVTEVSFDEELYRDFNELLGKYKDRINVVSGTVTGTVAAVVGILAGPLASLPSVGGPLILPRIIKTLWRKLGPNNWVFLMLGLKKKKV